MRFSLRRACEWRKVRRAVPRGIPRRRVAGGTQVPHTGRELRQVIGAHQVETFPQFVASRLEPLKGVVLDPLQHWLRKRLPILRQSILRPACFQLSLETLSPLPMPTLTPLVGPSSDRVRVLQREADQGGGASPRKRAQDQVKVERRVHAQAFGERCLLPFTLLPTGPGTAVATAARRAMPLVIAWLDAPLVGQVVAVHVTQEPRAQATHCRDLREQLGKFISRWEEFEHEPHLAPGQAPVRERIWLALHRRHAPEANGVERPRDKTETYEGSSSADFLEAFDTKGAAMDRRSRARLGSEKEVGYAADVLINGAPAADCREVAMALRTIFPNLPTVICDIAEDGLGGWLIPVPTQVGRAVLTGEDFAWTQAAVSRRGDSAWLISVFVPAIWAELP